MKKLILMALLLSCLLTGCVPQEDSDNYTTPNVYWVDCDGSFDYVVDRDTGIVYLIYKFGHCYGITPFYNSDGTLKMEDDIRKEK